MAAAWRQRGGSVAAARRQTAGRLRSGANTAHQHTGVVVCVCVWWSQPLWLSSPHSLPPTPNHFLTFTRPNTHATRLPPPLHPISCRHGHHRAVSNKGWACWPTTWWRQRRRQRGGRVAAAWRQRGGRQLVGSEAAQTLPTNTQGWWCVCVWWSQPLWLSSPHSLPPTPNHFLTFTRPNTHATRLPPPLHPISCRHGHHRAVSNKGWACWPTTWWRQRGGSAAAGWRQRGGRQLVGSEAAQTLPTNTQVVVVCVCGGLSLCGSPHHTHSRQLPTISSHSRARIRTPHTCHHRCIPFHAVMATTGQCLTRAGHAGRPQGGGRVAAGWRQRGGSVAAARRQTAGRLRGGTNTAHQHTGVVVCVCGGLSLCGSPHHTHSRQLPTISSHSRARIRTPHTCHHRCIPFHADMATTGQCLTRAGHAGRPHGGGSVAAAWRQSGGSSGGRRRQTAGHTAPRQHKHCPPTHSEGGGGVCVVVSASVALLTTLTPANSQPFPHIHAPEYARHTPATTVASHFMPTWPPQGSV